MSNSFNDLKKIYEQILEVNSDICLLIEKEEADKIQEFLNKKNELIKDASQAKRGANFSQEEKEDLNSIILNIKQKDTQLIKLIEKQKESLKQEIIGVAKSSKLVSAYKIKTEEPKPRVFDSKE